MTLGPNIVGFVEQSIQAVPDELKEELRNWITDACSGKLAEVDQRLLGEADAAWQTFDSAAKEVERKLQE